MGPRRWGTLPARSPAAAKHLPEDGLAPLWEGWGDRRHHLSPEHRQPLPQSTPAAFPQTRTFDRRRPQTIIIRVNHRALPF